MLERRPIDRRRQLERRGSHWIARLLLRWCGIGRRRCRRHGWDRRARLTWPKNLPLTWKDIVLS